MPRGAMIFIPQSKTDPGQGQWVFLAESSVVGAAADVDPVGTLLQLRELQGGAGFVFRTEQHRVGRLAAATVSFRLHKALAAAGVCDVSLYLSHSLRRGGATHAVAAGVSLRLLKVLGRWRSDTLLQDTYATVGQAMAAAVCWWPLFV